MEIDEANSIYDQFDTREGFRGMVDNARLEYRDQNVRNAKCYVLCTVCGSPFIANSTEISPKSPNCDKCGATLRWRSVAAIMSMLHSGLASPLPMLAPRKEVKVLGMTCVNSISKELERIYEYVNTFYDREPQYDVSKPCPERSNQYDIVISVEVMEHIAPPVSAGFRNIYDLLKPGGSLILTTPYTLADKTLEHFPDLHDYAIETEDERVYLTNTTLDGVTQVFDDLIFHGGSGFTLEMRRFSLSGLITTLEAAGFKKLCIMREALPAFGIYYKHKWSLPIVAVK